MSRRIWYMATPYSKYERGPEMAYEEACKCAALLLKRGLFVFSPVAHSHPIAQFGGLDPLCHKTWMPLDLALLDECDGLLVVMMPGWKESVGVRLEIERAQKSEKPISYLSWPMLSVREDEGVRNM